MTWLAVMLSIIRYSALPFVKIVTSLYSWSVIALAPVLYLLSYIVSALLWPIAILAKFETLYVYLGVAAVIGLIAGLILHLSSSILVSIFNLVSTPEEKIPIRTASSVRAAREQKMLDEGWKSSSSRESQGVDPSLRKQYADWLEKEAGKRRDSGLLGQTILEEDDDSDEL